MNYDSAIAKLQTINQEHLLNFFDSLTAEEKTNLLNQIDQLDISILKKQQQLITEKKHLKLEKVTPFTEAIHEKDLSTDLGEELLEAGKSACLIVAGGQGTRLGIKGPKGTCAVSSVKQKSLFQIFAEKTLAAEKLYSKTLHLAIMTSKENHQETLDFFEEHHFFGLKPSQISFFCQNNLPFLDLNGNLFLKNPSTISTGPDGNGGSLKAFFESGIFHAWMKDGVQFVNYILVDNPLADPFDAKLLSFQSRQKADIVVKCIRRQAPDESVGVLVNQGESLKVIEYSELSDKERHEKNEDGNLKHLFANISLYSFTMDFIKKIAVQTQDLMLHAALKQISYIDEKGFISQKKNAWKFEKFIFDVFAFAKTIKVVEFPRQKCFAPLKNLHGNHSLQTVQTSCELLDYETISKITGIIDPVLTPFEIAQDFYYPTDELLEKWKGKTISGKHYIEA
jgi:UDP-N-acetylglucosamine/UDP-N-acetylgalactosamine diphosphorylase